jgi:hypothetical protein
MIVAATFRGTEEKSMTDGVMNLIHTGIRLENHGDHSHIENGSPYKIVNAETDCGPVYHPHSSHGLLAAQCDGFMEGESLVNTSILVFDESKFQGTAGAESALLARFNLSGSHHGAAFPVDVDLILRSLATEDRLNAVANSSSLPATFEVVDLEGNVLESFEDTSDPSQSCAAFHGSAHVGDTYYFACSHAEEEHGGFFIVEYNKDGRNFSTRHLKYPSHPDLPNHRTGGIATHHDSPYVVTDFADWEAEVYAPQLLAFEANATEVGVDGILNLGPLGQCEYAFEEAHGEWIVVLLPAVSVQVYKPGPPWTLLAEVEIGNESWDECPWPSPFAVGYLQAFVFLNDTLHVLDLEHADEGTIHVSTLDLGFVPHSMNVAGVPKGYACLGDHDDHDDHDDEEEDVSEEQPSSVAKADESSSVAKADESSSEAKADEASTNGASANTNVVSAGVTQTWYLCISSLFVMLAATTMN